MPGLSQCWLESSFFELKIEGAMTQIRCIVSCEHVGVTGESELTLPGVGFQSELDVVFGSSNGGDIFA